MEHKSTLCVRYACLERPPASGAVPREGLQRTGLVGGTAPSGRMAWVGWNMNGF